MVGKYGSRKVREREENKTEKKGRGLRIRTEREICDSGEVGEREKERASEDYLDFQKCGSNW